MKLTKCEQCGGQTAEGLPLCPDCMRATGAAATDKSAKCPAYYTPETDGLKSPWNLAGGGCILQPSIRARGWEMGSQSLRGSPARRNRRSSDSGPD